MHYIGIDLGGTNVAAAVVDETGRILGRASLPTPRGVEAVADRMAESARAAADNAGLPWEQISSIGVGSPGTIQPESGVVKYWSNLEFEDVALSDLLSARLDRPVLLENDANAAALGEYAAGAGKGSVSMLAITLGTGVGGGAVFDGRLYTGFNYSGIDFPERRFHHPSNIGRGGNRQWNNNRR